MRADVFLADKGYAKSRSAAQALILSGAVFVNGNKISKPSEQIDENAENAVSVTQIQKYVGRGGYKLEYALEKFKVDVSDMTAIDVGASTGGFTDCLLQNGAKKVYILYLLMFALQGLGDTVQPMLSGVVELILRICVASTVALTGYEMGILLAEPTAWVGCTLYLWYHYRKKMKQ